MTPDDCGPELEGINVVTVMEGIKASAEPSQKNPNRRPERIALSKA
jgi:hypothetical protein